MYSIIEDIKSGSLKKVYLLYGTEQYLVHIYRDKLVKACTGKDIAELDGDMNFIRFSGVNTELKEVSESALTMPFFADKRVILLDGTEWFKRSNDEVATFFAEIPETSLVIFTEVSVDKRTNTYKALDKAGHAADFEELKEADVQKWICREVDRNHLKITVGAVNALMDATGPDLSALHNELEKLYAYCMEKDAIERADVEELTHMRATDRIFDMIEFMATKRKDDALKLYYDLLELREQPLRILNMLERQFRLLIAVKDLRGRGLNKNQIADKLQIKPFVADKCIGQAGHFEMRELKKALRDAAQFEKEAKSGGIQDRMAVEMLLITNSLER